MTIEYLYYCLLNISISYLKPYIGQSTGAVEYTDCTSAKE